MVFVCAAVGAALATTAAAWLGFMVFGVPVGILLGLVCGLLLARRGLSYPAKTLGMILGGGYLLVVVLSVVLGLVAGPLRGTYALILTAPWSFLVVSVSDALDPTLLDSLYAGPAIVVACATVNATVLYGLGSLLSLLNRAT